MELDEEALRALARQKKHSFLANEYLFLMPYARRPWPRLNRLGEDYWAPALKKLGLRHRNMYQTRHTYATLQIMAGANLVWVAAQLGNSIEVCSRVYVKWIRLADKARERAKLKALIEAHETATKLPRLDAPEKEKRTKSKR